MVTNPEDGGDEGVVCFGYPDGRDRVVQTAVLMVLEPIFEADFAEHSLRLSPRTGMHKAIDALRE